MSSQPPHRIERASQRACLAPLCALGLVALLATACGPGPDDDSGGDEKRESAVSMPISEPVHDRLAPTEGDSTDWKVFDVPVYETDATIRAWWDNPDALVTIVMRDQFGGKMYTLDHVLGKRKESWEGIRVRSGRYYLEITAAGAGATVYTLEITLAEGGPALDPNLLPPPE